jgi:hypothetical protein
MPVDTLTAGKKIIYAGRRFRVHSVSFFQGHAWIETADGTLITERLGTFVETL